MTDAGRKREKKTKGPQGAGDDDVAGATATSAAPLEAVAETAADSGSATGLEQELLAARAERDEYLDHLQRLKAEFENFRKRVQRDNQELQLRAGEGVVGSLLPVMDNMQRALEAAECHDDGQLVAGLELVAGQLRGALESHGLEEVPAAAGVPFDPNVHEAVLTQAHDDYPEGIIVQVLEAGYLLHGRLLRPTRVIVAS